MTHATASHTSGHHPMYRQPHAFRSPHVKEAQLPLAAGEEEGGLGGARV